MRIALLTRGPREHVDAILEHTRRLGEALRAAGADVDLLLLAPDRTWFIEGRDERLQLLPAVARYDLVLIQYNPFLWGRRGFAPWLPVMLWRLRLRRGRPRIALLVHELYLDLRLPWRWLAMGVWQRVQLW